MWSRKIEVDQLVSRPSGVQTQFMYYKYNYSIQQKNDRSHNDEDIGIYERGIGTPLTNGPSG